MAEGHCSLKLLLYVSKDLGDNISQIFVKKMTPTLRGRSGCLKEQTARWGSETALLSVESAVLKISEYAKIA